MKKTNSDIINFETVFGDVVHINVDDIAVIKRERASFNELTRVYGFDPSGLGKLKELAVTAETPKELIERVGQRVPLMLLHERKFGKTLAIPLNVIDFSILLTTQAGKNLPQTSIMASAINPFTIAIVKEGDHEIIAWKEKAKEQRQKNVLDTRRQKALDKVKDIDRVKTDISIKKRLILNKPPPKLKK